MLFLAAAAISGFTILQRLDPYDEGQILLAVRRVVEGHLPYGGFVFPYGPGHPLALALVQELFGPSLLWWRLVRVAADATVALLAFVLVRREAPLPAALLAWLIAATGMAQPGGPNPFSVALAFGLGAFAVATAAAPDESGARRRALGAGALIALAAFWRLDFAVYAGAGTFAALIFAPDTGAVRARVAGVFVAAAAGIAALLYAPFAVRAGPGTLYHQMVGEGLQDAKYWTLPFPWPWRYSGPFRLLPPGSLAHDLKKLIDFNVPGILLLGLVLLVIAIATRARRVAWPWRWVGLLVFALGCLVYLRSRADAFHTQPLLVVLTVALTSAGAWFAGERRGAGSGRGSDPAGGRARLALPAGIGLVLVLLALHGTANRLSALLGPPHLERVGLPGTSGVTDTPANVQALRQVIPYVQARVPPGQPIFVAPRRSDLVDLEDLLFYVLVNRDSVLDVGATLEALPAQQRRTVAALRRSQPRIVVRWISALSDHPEPNLRGRSTGSHILDDYLARAYQPVARFGVYVVLQRLSFAPGRATP